MELLSGIIGTDHDGPNWDASKEISTQAVLDTRNIWTTLPNQTCVVGTIFQKITKVT